MVINPIQYKWLTISSVIFCNVISMPCGAKPITHMVAMRSRPMAVMSSHLHQSADWSGTSFDPVCPLHDFLNRLIHLQPCFPSTSSREMQNIIFYYYMAWLAWFWLVKKWPLNRTNDCCQLILKLLCKYASTWLEASCFSHNKIYVCRQRWTVTKYIYLSIALNPFNPKFFPDMKISKWCVISNPLK